MVEAVLLAICVRVFSALSVAVAVVMNGVVWNAFKLQLPLREYQQLENNNNTTTTTIESQCHHIAHILCVSVKKLDQATNCRRPPFNSFIHSQRVQKES